MPTFTFEAKSMAGEELKATREAKDKYDLSQSLRREGYVLIKAEEGKQNALANMNIKLPSFLSRVSVAEKMLFARNLAVIIASGLALARGLEILAEQTGSEKFKEVLNDVVASIRKGENFADALARHPKVFSDLFRAMVASGEKTGKLDESLKIVAFQLKRDYDLRRKIRGAMMYPAIIIFAMVTIGILMMIFVVPQLVTTFAEFKTELPTSTKIVIGFSNILSNHLLLFLASLVAAIFGAIAILRTRQGKNFMDFAVLHIPVIGKIAIKANSARTCRTLGSLLGSGVDVLESFSITEGVLTNHYYKEVIVEAKILVEKGSSISKVFIEHRKLYPILVGEMMAVGEETGKLSEMLFRLAAFYESEVSQATKDLSTIIEPVLMIIIGIFVGFFALSMITPLYDLAGSI